MVYLMLDGMRRYFFYYCLPNGYSGVIKIGQDMPCICTEDDKRANHFGLKCVTNDR
jgi:hypothetical protein